MIGIFPYRSTVELDKFPTSTFKFILICAVVHLITWRIKAVPTKFFELLNWFENLGFSPENPLSALTCIFVHADFGHLFFNMFFFWLFASAIEVKEGKRKFWKLVIISAFFSSYFSYLLKWLFLFAPDYGNPDIRLEREFSLWRTSVGASGVVSAFAGAYLVRFWRSKLYAVVDVFGVPVKRVIISPWVMVLVYWFINDLVIGILYQGFLPFTRTGHFAHLGGYISGFFLAWRWGFHKHMKKDWLLEQAEELKTAPFTGSEPALKIYLEALAFDRKDAHILLEIARLYYRLQNYEKSYEYYRWAIIRLFEQKNKDELEKAYQEALSRVELVFLSEKQLELVRLLLKCGEWQLAQYALEKYISEMSKRPKLSKAKSSYIRANIILAYILDFYLHHTQQARELVTKIIQEFPNYPISRYLKQRLENCKDDELFYINPNIKGFPFINKPARKKVKKVFSMPAKKEFFKFQVNKKYLILLALSVPLGYLLFVLIISLMPILSAVFRGIFGF